MGLRLRLTAAIGRFLVGISFILLGISSIYNFELMKSDLARSLTSLEMHSNSLPDLAETAGKLRDSVVVVLCVGIFLQIVGGLFVLTGFRFRLGSFFLLLYFIPASFIAHHFWFLEGSEFARSLVLFFMDLSTIGALFLIFSFSSGGKIKKLGIKRLKEVSNEREIDEDE